MKKTLITFVLLSAGFATAANAAEERWPRWYVGLSGSLNYVPDADVSGSLVDNKINFDNPGWGAGISLGYMPPSAAGLRLEGEVYYRHASVDNIGANGGGDVQSVAYMANAYYDFQTGSPWAPYIGAGLGAATVKADVHSTAFTANDDDIVFAYQLMAGVGYTPQTIPNTQWTIGYRYFGTQDASIGGTPSSADIQHSSHNVEAGLKMRF